MKHIILGLLISLLLNGCSIVNYFEKQHALKEFNKMCDINTLYICNDIKIEYAKNNIHYDLKQFSLDNTYIYVPDKKDKYTYMQGNPLQGDCEDWSVTFIENNFRNGYLQQDTVELIFGKHKGNAHIWTLITIDNVIWLFDNNKPHSILMELAYNKQGYREHFIIKRF